MKIEQIQIVEEGDTMLRASFLLTDYSKNLTTLPFPRTASVDDVTINIQNAIDVFIVNRADSNVQLLKDTFDGLQIDTDSDSLNAVVQTKLSLELTTKAI